ncbi:MAG: alcohol dehydrogenase catalytic domain-containing protein, partial [Ilumatobacteraceae bacterium]
MKALQIKRSAGKFGMARLASAIAPATAARLGPLEYTSVDDPPCPGEGWQRVHTRLAGICGSDLSLVEGHASLYFEDYVSFPFVPGHEIVGSLDDGTRVVVEPVLGHAARGHRPPFDGAAPGDGDDYAHLVTGPLEPGIQTGFCCSTGGGWAPWFWAHDSQLHRIGDDVPDERAVLVEPIAGGIHAALLTWPTVAGVTDPVVAVLGAGTMGLAAIAGLRRYVPGVRIVAGARYPHQLALARAVGADFVVRGSDL